MDFKYIISQFLGIQDIIIEDIKPGDWVAIHILDLQVGPYGYYNNGGPFRGGLRSVAPVRDGLVYFPPDFVVPARPMIGVIQLEQVRKSFTMPGGSASTSSTTFANRSSKEVITGLWTIAIAPLALASSIHSPLVAVALAR